MPYYRTNKIASLILASIALLFACSSFIRNLLYIGNPTGAGLNLATIIFLFGGIVFIAKDRRSSKPPQ